MLDHPYIWFVFHDRRPAIIKIDEQMSLNAIDSRMNLHVRLPRLYNTCDRDRDMDRKSTASGRRAVYNLHTCVTQLNRMIS